MNGKLTLYKKPFPANVWISYRQVNGYMGDWMPHGSWPSVEEAVSG
ncbi:MAG: hypothetical protein LBL76_01765 [Treponema sp.]|nr:hypothetical protein [Treponema sp.]